MTHTFTVEMAGVENLPRMSLDIGKKYSVKEIIEYWNKDNLNFIINEVVFQIRDFELYLKNIKMPLPMNCKVVFLAWDKIQLIIEKSEFALFRMSIP